MKNDTLRMKPTVLVVGASGRFAGLVVPELVRAGATVRALVRNETNAAVARANGAAEIAFGDLRDRQSLETAAHGVDGVFHIGPAFLADEAELGVNMVTAARSAGVRRFVFSSVMPPTHVSLANHASKVPVEDAIFRSGPEFTILYPAVFLQNIAGAWKTVLEQGVFGEPFPKTIPIARVDYRDVAEVAAMALVSDRLVGGTFELAAATINREEIVATMSDLLGRPIHASEPSFADWAAKLPYDDEQKRIFERIFAHYRDHGFAGNSLTLRAILGREPRTLPQFLEDMVAATATAAA